MGNGEKIFFPVIAADQKNSTCKVAVDGIRFLRVAFECARTSTMRRGGTALLYFAALLFWPISAAPVSSFRMVFLCFGIILHISHILHQKQLVDRRRCSTSWSCGEGINPRIDNFSQTVSEVPDLKHNHERADLRSP